MMHFLWLRREDNERLFDASVRWLIGCGGAEDGAKLHDVTIMCVFHDDAQMNGVVAFHDYFPEKGVASVSVAFADPRVALSRRMWQELVSFATEDMRVDVLKTCISEGNRRSLRLHEAAGFRLFRIPDAAGLGRSEYIGILTLERWENSVLGRRLKHGRKSAEADSSS